MTDSKVFRTEQVPASLLGLARAIRGLFAENLGSTDGVAITHFTTHVSDM